MPRKLLIVWNAAKNEGVVFLDDDDGRRDAVNTAHRLQFNGASTLGEFFAHDCYEDDDLTLEEVTLP